MSEGFIGAFGGTCRALQGSGESVGARGGCRVVGLGGPVGVRGACGHQSGLVGVCENQEVCEHFWASVGA